MRALSGLNPGPMNTSAAGTAEGHWGRPEGLFEGLSVLPSATMPVLTHGSVNKKLDAGVKKNDPSSALPQRQSLRA